MKKFMAILFAAIMMCSVFAISASAAANVVDYDYIVELEQYSDGYVFVSYEFPERFATTNNPYSTDLLWVDIWMFEAGTEPYQGQELFDNMLASTDDVSSHRLFKTASDGEFLATERWIGPVFDDAESVFLFETGKTYNMYFGCCNGAEWYYYSKPYTFTFTETAYGAGSTETEPPVTEAPSTEAPTQATTDAPADPIESTEPTDTPDDPAPANNGWILWVAIGAAVVIVVVVVVVLASKKKKAE